jgi:hypothetical protein
MFDVRSDPTTVRGFECYALLVAAAPSIRHPPALTYSGFTEF